MTGVTGRDEVLLIRGVNIFVSDNDLEIEAFSCETFGDAPSTMLAAFSTSLEGLRYKKLNLGKRLLKGDLLLDKEGPGDSLTLALLGPEFGVKRKLTLLGVGVGVIGIAITRVSREDTSFRGGMSRKRFCRLQ